jgi:hypothetical protein
MNSTSGKRARVVHAPRETWVFTQAAPGEGWAPTATSSNHLMVIEDGAGTRQNGHVYARLERMGYELTRVAAGPNRSFAYPPRWVDAVPVSGSHSTT